MTKTPMTTLTKATTLHCQTCRAQLPAYAARELPLSERRTVAAHLDSCPRCNAEYKRLRDVQGELARTLPALGIADARGLARIWSAVQHEVKRPRRTPWQRYPRRLSVAVMFVFAALLIPIALGGQRLALALPFPPTPITSNVGETPAETAPSEASELANRTPTQIAFGAALLTIQVTPPAQPNYAPYLAMGATKPPGDQ